MDYGQLLFLERVKVKISLILRQSTVSQMCLLDGLYNTTITKMIISMHPRINISLNKAVLEDIKVYIIVHRLVVEVYVLHNDKCWHP